MRKQSLAPRAREDALVRYFHGWRFCRAHLRAHGEALARFVHAEIARGAARAQLSEVLQHLAIYVFRYIATHELQASTKVQARLYVGELRVVEALAHEELGLHLNAAPAHLLATNLQLVQERVIANWIQATATPHGFLLTDVLDLLAARHQLRALWAHDADDLETLTHVDAPTTDFPQAGKHGFSSSTRFEQVDARVAHLCARLQAHQDISVSRDRLHIRYQSAHVRAQFYQLVFCHRVCGGRFFSLL